MSVNKVILVGNLGDDVKMHYFEGGGCIGRFPLATSEHWKDKQTGEKKTSTEWHQVIVRNAQAEVCNQYLSKGDRIYIEGKIKSRKWTDDNGHERKWVEIHTSHFQFITTKGKSDSNEEGDMVLEQDDDLPF